MSNGMPTRDSITKRRSWGDADGVLRSPAVTFPRLVVHAAIAGLYGGCVVALLLRLVNPSGPAGGRWSAAGGLLIVLAYAVAAAVGWPVLYAALRFFASHRLHLTW